MSRMQAAMELGVDAGTLAKRERGEREPAGGMLGRVNRFLCEEARSVSAHTRLVGDSRIQTAIPSTEVGAGHQAVDRGACKVVHARHNMPVLVLNKPRGLGDLMAVADSGGQRQLFHSSTAASIKP